MKHNAIAQNRIGAGDIVEVDTVEETVTRLAASPPAGYKELEASYLRLLDHARAVVQDSHRHISFTDAYEDGDFFLVPCRAFEILKMTVASQNAPVNARDVIR